jgi:hypothetical protein
LIVNEEVVMRSRLCTPGRFVTALGLGLLSLLLMPATAATRTPITGSYWYLIDHITSVADDAEVTLWLALPPDRPDQNIVMSTVEPAPSEILTDQATGLQVAYWQVKPQRDQQHMFFHFDFTVELITPRNEVDPAKVEPYDTDSDLFRRFTVAEDWIETGGDVAQLAGEIVGDESNPYLRAQLVYDWVTATIRFAPSGLSERSAAATIASGQGDCGQISLAFTALCRAAGVPCRTIECTWFGGGRHRHAEFYLAGYGWLPADPAAAQILKDDELLSPEETEVFLRERGIPLDATPSWFFGNGFGDHLHVSVGNNIRLAATGTDPITFNYLAPGGVIAEPPAIRIRGLNDDVVNGGFFVFDRTLADDDAVLAFAYQTLAASYFSAGEYEKVEQGCLKSLDHDDSLTAWMNRGRVYMAKGAYYKAEAAFNRALTAPYTDPPQKARAKVWAHNFLGNCYDLLGHRDLAVAEYEQVIEMGYNIQGAMDYARKYLDTPFQESDL